MRIAINTLPVRRQLYGVGNYVKYLVHWLSILDRKNQYVLFVSRENAMHFAGLGENFELCYAPSNRPWRLIWERTVLPVEIKKRRIELLHAVTYSPVWRAPCRTITTIHDMTFLLTPERHTLAKRIYFQRVILRACQLSSAVVTDSESSKTDIVRLTGIPSGRISVISLGVDERYRRVDDVAKLEEVGRKYRLPRRFILFLGLIEPRKNLATLVEAFRSARELQSEYGLVIAGGLGWGYEGLLRRIRKSGVENLIHFPGYVADEDMAALYSLCSVFVYPSIYEGFGLPVAEAMACGAPTITSNVSSLPEVAGDAAILIDPHDADALGSALKRVLHDRELQRWLSERAMSRAQRFTWSSAAAQTLELYEKQP